MKRELSRRRFMRMGAAGLAGATLGCSSKRPPTGEAVCRTLGRTGLKLPIVSMGSCYAINLVQSALDEGIVYIHTSSGYGEQEHERRMGEVFRGRPRDSFVIATSPDLPYSFDRGRGRSLGLGKRADPVSIVESMEGSLERLGLDYVDIFYLTSIATREVVLFEPYVKAFEQLKRDGKTRFVGIGTHENEPEVIRAAVESGSWDIVLTAYNFRQSHRSEIRAAIAEAAEAGLGVVAMKTQAGVYWDRTRLRKINMQAALKWVLADENVHTTIPAFATYDEMYEDIAVMKDPALTPEELRDLKLGEDLGFIGNYCQQCGECLAQCSREMDVPTLMRAYMYACGHGELRKARKTLHGGALADLACTHCDACTVACAQGFDVKSRALELAGLLA